MCNLYKLVGVDFGDLAEIRFGFLGIRYSPLRTVVLKDTILDLKAFSFTENILIYVKGLYSIRFFIYNTPSRCLLRCIPSPIPDKREHFALMIQGTFCVLG